MKYSSIEIQRISSDKLGTHYGLYLDNLLIHYEFSRSSAEGIAARINNDEVLYEIIKKELNSLYDKKIKSVTKSFEKVIEEKDYSINELETKYLLLKQKIIKNEKNYCKNNQKLKKRLSKLKVKIESPDKLKAVKKNKKENALELLLLQLSNDDPKKEFEQLVAEIKPLRFTRSSQVSRYIINNKLGRKYKNISGILEMEQNGTSWKFKGGFPTDIYAKLCKELRLKNKGSHARPVKFTPFKDL